jgi:plasmid stability protein
VPKEPNEALPAHAGTHRKSISAEVIELLQENVPTAAELARRKQFLELAIRISGQRPCAPGPFPSAEEMQREDRLR